MTQPTLRNSSPTPITRRSLLAALLGSATLGACGGGGNSGGNPTSAGTSGDSLTDGSAPAPAAPVPVQQGQPTSWQALSAPSRPSAVNVYAPDVALLPGGLAVMVWAQQEGLAPARLRLYTSFCDPASDAWSAAELVGDADAPSGAIIPGSVRVAAQPGSGDVFVLWSGTTDTGSRGALMLRRRRAATGHWDEPLMLAPTSDSTAAVACAASGHVVVTWQSAALGMTAYCIAPDDTASSMQCERAQPGHAVVDRQGRVTLSWIANGRAWLAQSGTPSWTSPVEAGRSRINGEWFHSLAVAPDGEVALAWSSDEGSVATLIWRDSARFVTPPTVRQRSSSGSPALCWTPAGWALAFVASAMEPAYYGQGRASENAAYFSRFQAAQGRWDEPALLSDSGAQGVNTIELAVDGQGELTAVIRGNAQAALSPATQGGAWQVQTMIDRDWDAAFDMDSSGGRPVLAWSTGASLASRRRQ